MPIERSPSPRRSQIIVTLLVKAPRRNSAAYAFGEVSPTETGANLDQRLIAALPCSSIRPLAAGLLVGASVSACYKLLIL